MEALRKVLEEKGLDFDQVMQELQAEQAILTYLRQVGQGAANLVGEQGWVSLEVIVEEERIMVAITGGTLRSRSVEFDRKSQTASGSSGSSGSRDGKGPKVASLLQEAAQAFGLALKEWQVRSVSYHGPEVMRWLLKQTNGAIKSHPAFQEAVRAYKEWHPEKPLPQEVD